LPKIRNNIPLKDEHLPIGPDMDTSVIARFKQLMQDTPDTGVIILEHRKLEEATQSKDYIESQEYQGIMKA